MTCEDLHFLPGKIHFAPNVLTSVSLWLGNLISYTNWRYLLYKVLLHYELVVLYHQVFLDVS